METRANFILIGAFTLFGFLGLMGFFVWFSKAELDRQFSYYDVYFDNVSGLDRASDVRFAGLSVGQVVQIQLSDRGDGLVRARIEVEAGTPIRTDSVASIESQGVTGVGYVGITSGTPENPLLRSVARGTVPEITAGRSLLQNLSEAAPRLLEEAIGVTESLNALLSEENRGAVEEILGNLNSASRQFDRTLSEFATVAEDVGTSVSEIARFTGELEGITSAVESTLSLADGALLAIENVSEQAEVAFEAGTTTLRTADEVLGNDVRRAIAEIADTSGALREQTLILSAEATVLLDAWAQAGVEASDRLSEAQELLSSTDLMIVDLVETLDSVDSAAVTFEELLEGDGYLLVEEARALVAQASTAADGIAATVEEDLPLLMTDLSETIASARSDIETIGADLSRASGRVDGLTDRAEETLTSVTRSFQRANETLGLLDQVLTTSDKTLSAAERAFTSADRVLEEDVGAITADLRAAITRIEGAIAAVADDIPTITADVRAAASAARTAFADVSSITGDARGPLDDFLAAGLPQFTRLGQETRQLVATLESLVERIERDPARFFLSRETPEFRR
ncbi:MlaD family protein [Poseidonocella sedimentorum]|uniref:Phospholipid/cholesterol/gamma-HCH transport system substrate-binding protein n=1 Tax=Poseidonocella sedimentorum TaxID=871652 RepID=A0A1I6E898_9RHOB|nr:MlaD family protein [Poseidonocella sedimentorum]SFR13954.1 phospholipid/cholesterol/gamma-HCH transport system substrate-binding protein [Poseidonocella sedimentorum]